MDLVIDTTIIIEEFLENNKERSMLDPQERDSYGIGLPTINAWGQVNPSCTSGVATAKLAPSPPGHS